MDRINIARQLHKEKCNCAQAILVAYHDVMNIEKDQAYKLADGLGAGFGKMGGLCGAVNAMGIVISYINAGDLDHKGETKDESAKEVRLCAEKFMTKNKYLDCIPLKAENNDNRSCNDLVADCAMIIEEYIKERGNK
ncbi:MAG: C-GCAxxG-C-C family protein [Erysipelotrichaceae bacterium]|nr:C-GCAxxG-C-C family protein [Erysipelotrichaceae bacterium]